MGADVRFGKPCLTGTRIDVAMVVSLPAAGDLANDCPAGAVRLRVRQARPSS
jgi:hypothetical protein